MARSPQNVRGAIKRIASIDMSTAEAVLKAAMTLIVPDDQSQRKAFVTLMPYLYVLRNKGCSWSQLTMLINDCGFDLQPASVRTYYGEMLADRQDVCQERMNEQILLLAAVRKETKGAELSSISERVISIMEKQRAASSSKIDNWFGGSSATPVAQTSTAVLNETAKPVLAENKNSGLLLAPLNTPPSEDEASGSFGLLNLKPAGKKASKALAFLSQDDSTPAIPDLQIAKTASENKNSELRPAPPFPPPESKSQIDASPSRELRCLALKDGLPQLKKRENVPPELYLPGDLEHPKIPGLMLSLEARLYGAALEYADQNGEVKIETLDEKRFRVSWKKPVAMTQTRTGDSFTKMDASSYEKQKATK